MPAERPLAARPGARLVPLITVSLFLLLSGCIVGDFISVYFNTFYNASRLFDEAEQEVLTRPEMKAPARAYLAPFDIAAGTKTKFTSVIEKCSKLLQYHPDSRFVPDALMMIGKSYYYEDENQSAERKFNELLSAYPEHSLALDAKLWLSYTYYRMGEKDKSASAGKDVVDLGQKAGRDQVVSDAAELLAELASEGTDYESAEKYFQIAAERAGTDEERSRHYLQVAETYALQKNFSSAEEAYVRAGKLSSNYAGEYHAAIGQARMLARQGKYPESLARLRVLRSNLNNKEFFAEIDLERANVLRDQGDYTAAVDMYRTVDTAYARTESAAKACYEAGMIYEKKLMLFDSARVFYALGKGQSPTAEVTPLLVKRSANMEQYFQVTREMARIDTLLTADTTVVVDTSAARQAGAPPDSGKPAAPRPVRLSRDSLKTRLASDENELAGIFYTGLDRPDSAEYWFRHLLKEYPGNPYTPRAYYILAQISSQDSTRPPGTADSLYRLILRDYPESEFAAEAARILGVPLRAKVIDPAELMYTRAESLMVAGNSDAAIDSLGAIRDRFPLSPVAARAQYAIAWVYDNEKGIPDSVLSSYRRLVELYPNSTYAVKVKPILTTVAAERAAVGTRDTTTRKDTTVVRKDTAARVEAPPPPPEPRAAPGQGRLSRFPPRRPTEDSPFPPRQPAADSTARRP